MSARGIRRLEIAAGLLKLGHGVDVLTHIKAMPPDRRNDLREIVDWVEDYEKYDAQ